jgi:G3E family GTPase
VLVNDFGEVSIDADLIVGAEGDVLSLAGGCVCCSIGADLVGALAQVVARTPRPHVVLVETSGVGLPAAVAHTAALVPQVRVEQIVVVADAAAVRAQAAERYVGGTVRRQLSEADLVLLGKCDLVQPQQLAEVEAWLREELGIAAPCMAMQAPKEGDAQGADLTGLADLVLGPVVERAPGVSMADGAETAAGTSASIAAFTPRPLRPDALAAAQRFVANTHRFGQAVDTAALGAALLAQGVLRAKGVLLDVAGGWQELQVAGGRVHRRPAATPPHVARDGADDTAEAAGCLVTISLRHG